MIQKFVFSLPVNCDLMFSNHKGKYKKSIEKRQRKLITKIAFIKPFLEKDETVLLLTRGYSTNSLIGRLLLGWLLIMFKRSTFVFTNKRIFHIPTTFDYSYRHSIAQIVYSRCRSIRLKLGTLTIECASCPHKDRFTGISGKEKKKIKELLKTLNFGGDTNRSPHIEYLCPRCSGALKPHRYTCNKCRLEFRSKGRARLLSLLVPGGGYFYVRNVFLGVINAMLEVVALSGVGLGIYLILKGESIGLNDQMLGWEFVVLSVALLVFKKIATVIVAGQFIGEFIPKPKTVKVSKALTS